MPVKSKLKVENYFEFWIIFKNFSNFFFKDFVKKLKFPKKKVNTLKNSFWAGTIRVLMSNLHFYNKSFMYRKSFA